MLGVGHNSDYIKAHSLALSSRRCSSTVLALLSVLSLSLTAVNFLQTSSRLLYGIEDFRHNMVSFWEEVVCDNHVTA